MQISSSLTRVSWKVHRLTMMQWSNLTKCGLIFNIHVVSPAVHTLLPSALQRLDSGSIEALILILKNVPNCRYDLIGPILLLLLSCWGTVRWCQIRRIWRVINQLKPTVTYSSHCNPKPVCRSIVLVKQDSLRQISRPFWNACSTTFQSPELLIQSCQPLRKNRICYESRKGIRKYESASKKYEFMGEKKKNLTKDRGIDAILANMYTVYDIYFSVIRSRMLPPFISDVKDNTRHLFLASYGAEFSCHSFLTLKTNTRHLA